MRPRSDAEFEAERIGSPGRARRVDLRRSLYSFRHAGRGFAWAVSSQANVRVHLIAAAAVIVGALILRFSLIEFTILLASLYDWAATGPSSAASRGSRATKDALTRPPPASAKFIYAFLCQAGTASPAGSLVLSALILSRIWAACSNSSGGR